MSPKDRSRRSCGQPRRSLFQLRHGRAGRRAARQSRARPSPSPDGRARAGAAPVEESHNAETGLQRDGGRQRPAPQVARVRRHRLPSPRRPHGVNGVRKRQQTQRIGHHAVVELHRQRVLEEIAPPGLLEEQPRRPQAPARRRSAARCCRPVRPQAGHQRAEIDLHETSTTSASAVARGCAAPGGCARGLSRCAVQSDRGINRASERQMKCQPVLRNARRGRRGPTPPSTSRPRPAARPVRKSPTADAAVRGRSSRARGTRGTAGGTQRR